MTATAAAAGHTQPAAQPRKSGKPGKAPCISPNFTTAARHPAGVTSAFHRNGDPA